jgi:methionine-rich copper-binding protein CopC
VECADDVPAVPVVTATDNCTAPIDVEYFEVTVPGACTNQYQVVRTWTAEDFCGNSTIFVQTITVSDTEAPELAVKPLRRHYDCVEDVEAAPYQFATDNCDVAFVDYAETSNPGNCPNSVTIYRTWTAYDLCGNTSIWEQEIIVLDTIAPVFVVTPVDRTYECLDDVQGAPDQGTIATDNCGVVFVDFLETRDNDSCHNQVIIIRRWEATDLCGNKNTHWQTITVYDDEAPVLATTPTDRTYDCLEDVEAAPVQVATDNCGVLTYNFEQTENPGICLNQVVITRRWYAYDLCGNSVEHWQTITVNDNVDPVVTAPAGITLDCGDISETTDPSATVTNWLAAATATDNCDQTVDITYNFDVTTLDVCVGGTLTVTWTATDACGNTGTATSTITVVPDTEDPIVTAPAGITLDCGDISETTDPGATVSNWLESATATDNCDTDPELTYNFDATTLDVCVGGTLTVTWTATDACGNVGTATSTITVVPDTEDPIVTAPAGITLDCGDISETTDPGATVSNWLESATASDNCDTDPELTYNFDATTLDVCVGGTLTVTWTATDACGNTATATSTITVVPDTEDPIVTAPAGITLDCGDISETTDPGAAISNWLESATASDNCDTDPDLTYNFDVTTLDVCVGGTLTVTWTATDACGNNSHGNLDDHGGTGYGRPDRSRRLPASRWTAAISAKRPIRRLPSATGWKAPRQRTTAIPIRS